MVLLFLLKKQNAAQASYPMRKGSVCSTGGGSRCVAELFAGDLAPYLEG